MVAFKLCGSSGGAKELDSRQILKMEPKVFAIRLNVNGGEGRRRRRGGGGRDRL